MQPYDQTEALLQHKPLSYKSQKKKSQNKPQTKHTDIFILLCETTKCCVCAN